MTKEIKVLHFTTHDEECGIGKYQEQFLHSMKNDLSTQNTVFEYSPNKTKVMTENEFRPVLKQFAGQMKDYDILHVQHEFSFYSGSELDAIVSEAKHQSKKIIITVHTSLDAGFPEFSIKDLKKVRTLFGKKRLSQNLTATHVVPIRKADLVIVHNEVIRDSLLKRGVKRQNIIKIPMPVPVVSFDNISSNISTKLSKKTGDIIFCTVGFLSEHKGMKEAVRAIEILPKRYKLAIIGGSHPSGANDAFIAELAKMIDQLKLNNRVYITGYIKEDSELNALIRECDICIYPYSKKYYAGVTSAALNNALANHKPVIAYPTDSIKEMNELAEVVKLCKTFDYHELANNIMTVDIKKQSAISKDYAEAFSYDGEAKKLVGIYKDLVNGLSVQ